MAEFVLKNAYTLINSVDLSDHVRSVEITYSAEQQDQTAMTDSGRERLPGLKDFNASIEFNQDYAASEVDATLFPLIGATAFPVEFRHTSTAVRSATNPGFTGSMTLESYPPISGAIGDIATASASLLGFGVLTRSTSAT